MSYAKYKDLPCVKVCISGCTGKSGVFEAAAAVFGLDMEEAGRNDLFYYKLETADNKSIQIHVINCFDLDNPHGFTVSVGNYRNARCIILVYDSTDIATLDKVCSHYHDVIKGKVNNARIVLLRNNKFMRENGVSVNVNDEAKYFAEYNLLPTQNYSINVMNQYRRFSILTPDHRNVIDNEEVSNFFRHELLNICDMESSTSDVVFPPSKCWCCLYLSCCCCCKCSCCTPNEEDDIQALV